ncbi:hypothetical protein Bxe_B0204 [Paraburkholderia xenovorans LB400]|uniref:Uncharacterized protein n=1 Tax=Paraburkholderia xenovorans (strain LB400) TaxID=266265 RepID=Q13JK0_PARXL|nr:hypothetical protein Bxe_B0204 [Paraburkholderia xenovorans LB400]
MKPAARPRGTSFGTCRHGSEASRRGFAQRSDELVQHDGGDQAGSADEAQQLQQREGFTGCGRDLLRSHGLFLKIGKSEMVHGSAAGACRLAQTAVH